jgi:DnaJ-class molecular chaperone
MNLPRNFYSILEIGRHDNIFEIRRSYKSLSKIYHPDKNSAENAADVFQIIKTSYDVSAR